MPEPSRAIVRLTLACSNACVFCAQAGSAAAIDDQQLADELERLRHQHDELSFVGGEPTLVERLPEWIAEARALGFRAIGLQTNAGALPPERLSASIDAGLTDLQLSLHGPTAQIHDYHTGRPGSFASTQALLERARRAKLSCVVATVITRSNFRELQRMPTMLERLGVAAWLLEWVRPFGRAGESFTRVVPRFGMALPWALHALEQARRVNLKAWIRGAPLCTLGPFVVHASELHVPEPAREHPQPCASCSERERCVGVDRAYLECFGAGELDGRRLDAARLRASRLDPTHARALRMFVGVGELVEPAAPAPHASKHRRLPVLALDPRDRAESSE